jgi:uncharacterized protein YeaO (DUF488 family)
MKITKHYRGYKKEYDELLELQKAVKGLEKYISRRITYVQKACKDIEEKNANEIQEILNQKII